MKELNCILDCLSRGWTRASSDKIETWCIYLIKRQGINWILSITDAVFINERCSLKDSSYFKITFLKSLWRFCRERSMEELQSMAFLNLKPLLYGKTKILFARMVQIDYWLLVFFPNNPCILLIGAALIQGWCLIK